MYCIVVQDVHYNSGGWHFAGGHALTPFGTKSENGEEFYLFKNSIKDETKTTDQYLTKIPKNWPSFLQI